MVTFVYFDVGGVVIKDFSGTQKWQQMKQDSGVSPLLNDDLDAFYSEFEGKVCRGLEIDTLIPELTAKFNLQFPPNYSLLTDFVTRFERNESIWSLITKIKQKYRIGLLTNMYPRMLDAIREQGLLPPIEWDVIVDSSLLKVAKPDQEIFTYAQKQATVPASEILFIENSLAHVQAASKLGWQTILYDPTNTQHSNQTISQYLAIV